MANIHVLPTFRNECNQSCVSVLRGLLAEAEQGAIVAVSVALVRNNGAINSQRSHCDDVGRLLGAMALAQSRMTAEIG